MRFSNQGRLHEQVRFLRRQYLQDGALPFSDILTDDFVTQAMTAVEGVWKDRIYTPLMTLWVFLRQVLSADHSCRGAVARLIAHRLSQGQSPCSPETTGNGLPRTRQPTSAAFIPKAPTRGPPRVTVRLPRRLINMRWPRRKQPACKR